MKSFEDPHKYNLLNNLICEVLHSQHLIGRDSTRYFKFQNQARKDKKLKDNLWKDD